MLKAESRHDPSKWESIWYGGKGYAWQDETFGAGWHPLKVRCARRHMLFVGIVLCGYSSWDHPCILYRYWRNH